MNNRKQTGSYYTPDFLSGFILRYVSNFFAGLASLSIFEPSVGDGSFVTAFNNTVFPHSIERFSFTAIDKILPELEKAKVNAQINRRRWTKYEFWEIDFLEYQKQTSRKFSLIVGNPPYIKKNLLNESQIALCQEIHASANLAPTSVKNIWSSFLVRCTQLLDDNGVLALVLPAELLQVKFSGELRSFLISNFERTEIFTFDDLLFECKGQDTVLLIGYKQSQDPGQYYTHIENVEQLVTNDFVLAQNNALAITETKWTHHLLNADELNFVHQLCQRLNVVDHYCDSKPGIVSAANSFFIVDEITEARFNLKDYTRPIIQKGYFVNGSVVFDNHDFENLVTSGKPTKILCFNDDDVNKMTEEVLEYLEIGASLNIPSRYKCTKRKNWFVIPNISTPSDGFFFKRSHRYPKLLKNDANILVTDSAYKIQMKNGYNIDHLIYSFYNSLTLTFAELYGRYYGGGVLELTPSEFKKLPIPFVDINPLEFANYTRDFENKENIGEVLASNDFRILNMSLELTDEEVGRIKSIYQKLIDKRFRRKP